MTYTLFRNFREKYSDSQHRVYLLLSLVAVAQFAYINHSIQHIRNFSDVACATCLVTPDYFDGTTEVHTLNISNECCIFTEKLKASISLIPETFYSSRAPPFIV